MKPVKFKQGDQVIVTGDTAGLNHDFKVGTVVILVTWQSYGASVRWRAVEISNSEDASLWWVDESDLEPAGPTEEEINQVVTSIQTRP